MKGLKGAYMHALKGLALRSTQPVVYAARRPKFKYTTEDARTLPPACFDMYRENHIEMHLFAFEFFVSRGAGYSNGTAFSTQYTSADVEIRKIARWLRTPKVFFSRRGASTRPSLPGVSLERPSASNSARRSKALARQGAEPASRSLVQPHSNIGFGSLLPCISVPYLSCIIHVIDDYFPD